MSEAVLAREDDRLPERSAALARFAVALTERPWSLSAEIGADLTAHGLDAATVQAATGTVAMFNYFTRVADASGIEFDYLSPLPRFQPERGREAVPRPDRDAWPVAEHRSLSSFPSMVEPWQNWHDYLFEADEPLTRRERRLLAAAAAQECTDRWRADELAGELGDPTPADDRERLLDAFARKLSLTPWQMSEADLDGLRAAGFGEKALLHAISLTALQNAESRLALGRRLADTLT